MSSVHDPLAPPATRPPRLWALALLPCIALSLPLLLRPVATALTADAPPSYLPSLGATYARRAFDPTFREDIRRIQPRYVLIGDSMLGSRIDPRHLSYVSGQQSWWVMQPGTGPAYWYLALKNVVLGAEVRPKVAFVFFRDFNMTDVLFRLDDQFRWSVDTVAGPVEPELDRAVARRLEGPWYLVPRTLDAVYRYRPVREAADRSLRTWAPRLVAGPGQAEALQAHLNGTFALDRLRPALAADMASGESELGDFHRMLPRSILPDLMALARDNGITLCLVRVQRRPGPDGPPPQSPVLRKYVADLRQYVEANGGVFRDDTGDPDYPLAWYTDGDHTAGRHRQRYTELFVQKLADLFQ
jgi:hypothetical protein